MPPALQNQDSVSPSFSPQVSVQPDADEASAAAATVSPSVSAKLASDVTAVPEEQTTRKPSSASGSITIPISSSFQNDIGCTWWAVSDATREIVRLIDGYCIVAHDRRGDLFLDPAVVEDYTTEEILSHQTYTITIRKGLRFNDGTEITAKHYAAYCLLINSPLLRSMGAAAASTPFLLGLSEYRSGTTPFLSGIRVIGDYTFSVSVSEHYYHDLYNLKIYPLAMHMWLSDTVSVITTEYGTCFTNWDEEKARKTISAARMLAEGRVCSGPYELSAFDPVKQTVTFLVNPAYVGNYENQTASIEKVIFQYVPKSNLFDTLYSGRIDVIRGLNEKEDVAKAKGKVSGSNQYALVSYPRMGYGKLTFQCDFGPAQFAGVRRAVAYLIDRQKLVYDFSGIASPTVNGPYSPSMWMYKEAKDEIDKLNPYPFSPEDAVKELQDAGFILDVNGQPYTSGLRYKAVSETESASDPDCVRLVDRRILMPCILHWAGSNNNPVTDLLEEQMVRSDTFLKAGIEIQLTRTTFTECLNFCYREASLGDQYALPTFEVFNLGINFTMPYDMSFRWTQDPLLLSQHYNENYLIDEELDRLSMDMVFATTPGDKAAFLSLWTAYIARMNELMPEIPLYNNELTDFHSSRIKHYDVSATWDFIDQLLYMEVEE